MTPYYADDTVTLYHGDCLDVLPALVGVDLVVTSPPYNLGTNPGGQFGHWRDGGNRGGNPDTMRWRGVADTGIGYGAHDDAMPYDAYRRWQHDVLRACWNTLSDQGAIFYNHKPRVQAGGLWTPLDLNPGLPLRQIVVWARAGGVNFTTTAYVPTHEWVLILARDGWRLRDKAASGIGDVWRIPQDPANEHPAPFPVGLPARAIETTAPRLVVDPFAGSGTSLRAAADAGVPAIGIERSERYCEMAVRRLAQGALDFGGVA